MTSWWFRSRRDKNREDFQLRQRVMDAALRGDHMCLTELVKNMACTSPEMLRLALSYAVCAHHPRCVHALLQAGASALGTIRDVHGEGDAATIVAEVEAKPLLVYSTEHGMDIVLGLLLQYGGDCTGTRRWKGGDTLLHMAARWGHTRCLRLLLQTVHHSSILSYNDAYETPATLAVTAGYYDCFLLLIADRGVEQMDGEGRNLLHLAAVHGKYAIVERLIEEGYAVDETDFEGHTPLIDAVLRGYLDIVKLLVQYSEIDFPADKERTALMFAAQTNSIESLQVLINAGAVLNKRDKHGNTALILGVKHEDITEMLLENGAITNMQNNSGVTALWYAAYYGVIRPLSILLKASSNPELTGEKSLFPLEVALERGNFEAAKCIIYAGCPIRNLIYTLKQYSTIQVINGLIGGMDFSDWVEEWLKQPHSLKYSTRNCIRLTLGTENISRRVSKLPLPRALIQYVDFIDLCQFFNKVDINKENP